MGFVSGDTFLNDSVPGAPEHLWIVATDPEGDPPSVVIVNVTSLVDDGKRHIDEACVLNESDHPFVRHDSFMKYKAAALVEVSTLQSLLAKGLIKSPAPVSAHVLQRVRQGFLDSEFSEKRFQDIVRPYLED